MYTPIIPSVVYVNKASVGLQFDETAFEDLVLFAIMGVRREINGFKRRQKSRDKYAFINKIGIGMEIVKSAIFLSVMCREDVKLKKETRLAIKKLSLEVNNLTFKLGQFDSDFSTDSSTQRACVDKEMIDFMKKKW